MGRTRKSLPNRRHSPHENRILIRLRAEHKTRRPRDESVHLPRVNRRYPCALVQGFASALQTVPSLHPAQDRPTPPPSRTIEPILRTHGLIARYFLGLAPRTQS